MRPIARGHRFWIKYCLRGRKFFSVWGRETVKFFIQKEILESDIECQSSVSAFPGRHPHPPALFIRGACLAIGLAEQKILSSQ